MATQKLAAGITVETSGGIKVGKVVKEPKPAAGRELAAPRPGRPRRAARRAPAAAARVPNESDIIAAAIADPDLKLVVAVPLEAEVATPRPGARRAGTRRRRAAAGEPEATLVGVAAVNVPLAPNERAVVLLEQDGVYRFQTPNEEIAAAPKAATKRKGVRRATAARPSRVAHFRIELNLTPQVVQPAARRQARGPRRLGFVRKIFGKAVAYVFKLVGKAVLKGVTKFLERDVKEGLVHLTSTDATTWTRDPDQATGSTSAAPRRVLLLVHGTFSSTLGSFAGLGTTPEGKQFLDAAFQRYDLIIGWDHKTLSVTPTDNARDLLAWLEAQAWKKPPVIDGIAFSRGGLVFRSLVEELLPSSGVQAKIGRAVFVGCTNGGTELARPANWRRFADVYINLAAAGVRALSLVPGFGAGPAILSEAVRGVGSFVKVLASAAIDDGAIPGLAAMNPAGEYVKRMNTRQVGQPAPDQVYYCAVTSNFDPDSARELGHTQEIPPGLFVKIFDKGADVLYGKPNDLVVHVEAMTQIDPDVGAYVREKLEYGTNGRVHHCRYFAEPETADALRRWLQAGEAGVGS